MSSRARKKAEARGEEYKAPKSSRPAEFKPDGHGNVKVEGEIPEENIVYRMQVLAVKNMIPEKPGAITVICKDMPANKHHGLTLLTGATRVMFEFYTQQAAGNLPKQQSKIIQAPGPLIVPGSGMPGRRH